MISTDLTVCCGSLFIHETKLPLEDTEPAGNSRRTKLEAKTSICAGGFSLLDGLLNCICCHSVPFCGGALGRETRHPLRITKQSKAVRKEFYFRAVVRWQHQYLQVCLLIIATAKER